MRWLDNITDSMHMNLVKLQEIVRVREARHIAVYGVAKSPIQFSDWTTRIFYKHALEIYSGNYLKLFYVTAVTKFVNWTGIRSLTFQSFCNLWTVIVLLQCLGKNTSSSRIFIKRTFLQVQVSDNFQIILGKKLKTSDGKLDGFIKLLTED